MGVFLKCCYKLLFSSLLFSTFFFLLGLETLTTSSSSQVADHLVATTKALATASRAQVFLHQSMLSINMASQVMLALEVQLATIVRAWEGEQVRVNSHVGLELRACREGLFAG